MWDLTASQRSVATATEFPIPYVRLMDCNLVFVQVMGGEYGMGRPGRVGLWDGDSGAVEVHHGVAGRFMGWYGARNGIYWGLELTRSV